MIREAEALTKTSFVTYYRNMRLIDEIDKIDFLESKQKNP
jgi:hypothetical protein